MQCKMLNIKLTGYSKLKFDAMFVVLDKVLFQWSMLIRHSRVLVIQKQVFPYARTYNVYSNFIASFKRDKINHKSDPKTE